MDRSCAPFRILCFLFLIACPAASDALSEESPPGRCSYGVGFAVLSAPHGDKTPFAEDGVGLTIQGWYAVLPWAAVGVQIGVHSASFDEEAFSDSIGCSGSGELTYSSPTMTDIDLMVRWEPLRWGGWRPFVDTGFVTMFWHEKYECDDLSPGPWFPSGSLYGVDETVTGRGWLIGTGFRYEDKSRIGFFFEAQGLFVSGHDLDGRWTRARAGVSWRP